MSTHEQEFLSKTLLRSFVPLTKLTDEQLDLLVSKSEIVHLYKGQTLVRAGDATAMHYYLIHGVLTLVNLQSETSEIQAGDASSHQPIAHEFPRRASVLAETDCSLLKIESNLLENLLCWGQVSRCLLAEIAANEKYSVDYLWIKKLLESKLFYKVPPTNIRNILDKFADETVVKGQKIIKEGDDGTSCYLVKSGIASVFVNKFGKKAIAELEPGSVFGEDALVTNNPRNASVFMKTDGVLMKLEKKDFYQLLTQPVVSMVTPGNVESLLETGAQLLDVRTQQEFELGHHVKAMNLPLSLVYLKSSMLDKEKSYITYSATEERAKAAAFLLNEQGYKVQALQLGIASLPRELVDTYTQAC